MSGLGKIPGAFTIASWLTRTEFKAPEETGLATVPCFLLSWYLAHDTRDCWDNFILPQIQFFWEKLADGGKLGKDMSEATPVPRFNQKASSRRASPPQASMAEAKR